MALLATSFTVEVLLLVFGTFLFTEGLIEKLGAEGLFIFTLQMSYKTQQYVSDLSASPSNVALFLTPDVQQAMVVMSATLALVCMGKAFVEIRNLLAFKRKNGRFPDDLWETLV